MFCYYIYILLFQLYLTVIYDIAYARKCFLVHRFENQPIFFNSSMEMTLLVKVRGEAIVVLGFFFDISLHFQQLIYSCVPPPNFVEDLLSQILYIRCWEALCRF